METPSKKSANTWSRTTPLALLTTVLLLIGCGDSGGGSGDDELHLFNMRAATSGDPALQSLCVLDGFEHAYVWVSEFEGDLDIGDTSFERFTFLPSGVTNVTEEPISQAPPGSGIGPNEVGDTGCYTGGGGDNRARIDVYIVTKDGFESNEVSDTFDI